MALDCIVIHNKFIVFLLNNYYYCFLARNCIHLINVFCVKICGLSDLFEW